MTFDPSCGKTECAFCEGVTAFRTNKLEKSNPYPPTDLSKSDDGYWDDPYVLWREGWVSECMIRRTFGR